MKINKETINTVLNALEESLKLSVAEVSSMIHVSEATTRRLFVYLESEGLVMRTFGGIQLPRANSGNYSFTMSSSLHTKEKVAIGRRAALEVQSGDHLFLDSGTTVLAMAQSLSKSLEAKTLTDIRVLTNSLILIDLLTPFCKVNLIGGEVRPERRDTCGFITEEMLKRLHVKKAFLGCDAVHETAGLMTTDERTARMNEILIENSAVIYVLADSSKMGERSFVSFGSLGRVNYCISDLAVSPEAKAWLSSQVGTLILAE